MNDKAKRVYWTKGQAAIVGIGITLVSVIGLASVLGYPRATIWTRLSGFILFGVVMWFFIVRVAFARLYVLADGVRIVNPLRTVFLPWGRIDHFSLRPWGLIWTPIGHADLKDGTSVHIIGIAGPNPAHWPRQKSAEVSITERNELLSSRRASE
jgi:hypothetical protein